MLPQRQVLIINSKYYYWTTLKFQTLDLLELPKFITALEYHDTFTFGHQKIDTILDLHLDDIIGIFGETIYTNALMTRLVVRSLLPRNHGGINAHNVMVIDADNSSNPYLYVILQDSMECIIEMYCVKWWSPDSLRYTG